MPLFAHKEIQQVLLKFLLFLHLLCLWFLTLIRWCIFVRCMKWCRLWLYLDLPLWLNAKLVLAFFLRLQIKVASLSAEVDFLCTLILAEALKSSAALWPSWQLDQHTAQMHCLDLLIKGWEQQIKGYNFSLRFQAIVMFSPNFGIPWCVNSWKPLFWILN